MVLNILDMFIVYFTLLVATQQSIYSCLRINDPQLQSVTIYSNV